MSYLTKTVLIATLLPAAYAMNAQPAPVPPTAPSCSLTYTRGRYCDFMKTLLKDVASNPAALPGDPIIDPDLNRLANPTANMSAFIQAATPSIATLLAGVASDPNSDFNKAVDDWEASRLDVQSGSTPTASGSTSLVAKSGLSTLLSAAYEVGAFTQTTSGDTTTFHLNAGGFLGAISHAGAVSSDKLKCTVDGSGHRTYYDPPFTWNNLAGSVSVDIDNSSSTTAAVSGSANSSTTVAPQNVMLPSATGRVGAVTLTYSFLAPYDPRSAKFQKAWDDDYTQNKKNLQNLASGYTAKLGAVAPSLGGAAIAPLVATYKAKFQADAAVGNGLKLEADFEDLFTQVLTVAGALDTTLATDLQQAQIAETAFAQANQAVLTDTRKAIGSSFTVEADYSHPVQQPETYTGRLIWSHPNGDALWTVNGAFTMYGAMPAGAKYQRLRDGQLSAEFDTPLGNPNSSIATLTGAFYMQYQTDPSVLNITAGNLVPGTSIMLPSNAQVLLGPSGLIVIGQGKLTIKTKSGISIPLAVEYANKTDLLNATDVRGNIGISYDFSSFSSLFGAKN